MATQVATTGLDSAAKAEKKEKTSKAKAGKKVKAPKMHAAHPTYCEMIVEAISFLKERTGSSQQAISKYIDGKYKAALPENYKKILSVQLRNLSKNGKLSKLKASYKLSEPLKKAAAAKKVVKSSTKDAPKVKSVKAKMAKVPKSSKEAKPVAPKPKKSSLVAKPLAKKEAASKKVQFALKVVKPAKSAGKLLKSASAIKPSAKSSPRKVVPAAKRAKKVGK